MKMASTRLHGTTTQKTAIFDSGPVLNASVHLLSCAIVSQSASENWCIKYSVTSSVKQMSFVCIDLFLPEPPAFVYVSQFKLAVNEVYTQSRLFVFS
jgi:hypothetical protein